MIPRARIRVLHLAAYLFAGAVFLAIGVASLGIGLLTA
jgi:hypothetical protein